VQRLVPDADVILFGSRARGDAAPDSDYDILVLCEGEEPPALKQAVQEALDEVALEHDAVAPALVHSRARWESPLARATPLHAAVAREGVLL